MTTKKDKAIKMDKEGGALIRLADSLLKKGKISESCTMLRKAMEIYKIIPSFDPEAKQNAEMVVAIIRVKIANCLVKSKSKSDIEEAMRNAKKAIPSLEDAVSRGVDKLDSYIKCAKRILSNKYEPKEEPGSEKQKENRKSSLQPAIWAAIIGAIALILAKVIDVLIMRN